jgi:hypothetical protein
MFRKIIFPQPSPQLSEIEQKRRSYAFFVNSGLFLFFSIVFVIHLTCAMGTAHYTADVLGIIGTLISIYLIRSNKMDSALKLLIGTCLTAIFLYGILVDYLHEVTVHFLRLYVTLFALEGTLLLMVSFFLDTVNYRYIALLFTSFSCHALWCNCSSLWYSAYYVGNDFLLYYCTCCYQFVVLHSFCDGSL